jgi:ABC-2 type transport system permease protein
MNELRDRFRFVFQLSLKEFRSFFYSPILYIVALVFLGFNGWLFVLPFFLKGQAELRDFFGALPVVFVIIIPMLTMRLLSEEVQSGSYELIATLPIKPVEIVLGKFLSSVYFICLLLVPTVLYAFSVEIVGDLAWGPVIGGYIGAILLGSAYAAIGLFTSSLTRNQIVAAIVGVIICLGFFLLDKTLILLPDALAGFLQYFSSDFHFQNIAKGIIDLRDLLYFASIIFVFLFATRLVMEDKTHRI